MAQVKTDRTADWRSVFEMSADKLSGGVKMVVALGLTNGVVVTMSHSEARELARQLNNAAGTEVK